LNDDLFTTIDQHWAHFLERDIPPNAPDVQVIAMKKAFAAGAISGLQLAVLAGREIDQAKRKAALKDHVSDIVKLDRGGN
jgi:hypothetical protein